MELKDITAKLKTIPNGANIGITYRGSISNKLNATAKKEGHVIEKEGRVVLRKGLKKDRDPENIPGPRKWGTHVSDEDSTTNGQSFIIEKNGGYYVDFYMGSAGGVGIQAPKYKYFLDGKEVSKEELEPYMQPAAYRLLEKPHDHYSIKIEHVIDIRYNGRRTEGLNEGCKDCVDQYERNVLNHIYELEDEGEYDAVEYFKNDFPMLIDYSETASTITLKFNDILDRSDLEQYLMYVPKHFDDDAIATARRVNGDTIVIKKNINGSKQTKGLNEEALTSGANKYEVTYQDDDGYGVKQTVITSKNIDDYLEYLYDCGFMYCDVIDEEPVNITNVDEAKKVIYVDGNEVPFMENENSVYVIDIDSYEEFDDLENLDDWGLEESYDDYEGGFSDPLESGEYSLSDFGYKNSYSGDHLTALSKRSSAYGSGSRRLAKDLNRNNRSAKAANESLTTSRKKRLNEHISDSEAQRYGYRNAAELKAANKINK